jgi:hypothetical protein
MLLKLRKSLFCLWDVSRKASKIVINGGRHAKQINIPISCDDPFSILRRADAASDGDGCSVFDANHRPDFNACTH